MNIKHLIEKYKKRGGKLTDAQIAVIIYPEKNPVTARCTFSYLKNNKYGQIRLQVKHVNRLCDFFECKPNDIFLKKDK